MLWPTLGASIVLFALVGSALGATMGLAGLIVLYLFAGGAVELAALSVWNLSSDYTLSAVPLFILLGDIIVAAGLSAQTYRAVAPFLEPIPGRLLHSNIVVSGLFSAVTGSSTATTAAVGSVAYSELRRRGYHLPSVAGSLAAGGTLGILFPPSLTLIIYGAWQNVSIGKLFLAGIIPGFLLIFLFIVYICIHSYYKPHVSPASPESVPLGHAMLGLLKLWPLFLLIGSVMGSLYAGFATTTEAAGVGILAAVILGFTIGDLTPRKLFEAFINASISLGTLSFIFFGAAILSQAITVLGIPGQIVGMVNGYNFDVYTLLLLTVFFYLVMGIFFDGIALMLTTIPFVFPVLTAAGVDPVWLGIFIVIMIEIGMLTPPVGVNLFVMLSIANRSLSMGSLGWACLPYWLVMLVAAALLTAFPQLALSLPGLLN